MKTFDRANLNTVSRFFSWVIEERDRKRILEVKSCLIFSSFLKGKAFHCFLSSRNISFYSKLHRWLEYISYFLSIYAKTFAILHEAMELKDS